ncbi:MAG: hypothetical protein M1368_06250 [Thaumarchaeota archaeon]|nr:hypothetical protein [Nitrososphaerota archaeon]
MRKAALLLLFVIAGLLAVPALPLSSAVGCPTYTTSSTNGYTFTVQVTGADGSCPSTYSSAGMIHYVLSTSSSANPYTVTLSNCIATSPATCPPAKVTYQGWTLPGVTTVCSGDCGSTITFTVDATVQAAQACNTLNVKASDDAGLPGGVALILEAGVGGDCSGSSTTTTTTTTSTTPGVPEFGAPLGMLLAIAIIAPMLLLVRKFSLSTAH